MQSYRPQTREGCETLCPKSYDVDPYLHVSTHATHAATHVATHGTTHDAIGISTHDTIRMPTGKVFGI